MNITAPGRRLVESRMVDECIITRDTTWYSDDILDETTGQLIKPAWDSSVIYSGKCSIKPGGRRVQELLLGDEPIALVLWMAFIPINSPLILTGDKLTQIRTGAVEDADLYDQSIKDVELRVLQIEGGTYRSARRVICEEVGTNIGGVKV